MKHRTVLSIDLYSTHVNVLVADTIYKALKQVYCHKEMPKEYWGKTTAVFNISPNKNCWSLAFKKGNVTAGTIAHECLHLTFAIMSSKGIKLGNKSEEAFTYLHGYLVDEVTGIIKSAGVKIW